MTAGGRASDTDRDERVRRLLRRRRDVLGALCDEPLTKPSLVDRLDVSRSTVDRTLKSLTAYGLVRREGGSFSVSAAGRLASESVERYRETTATVARTASLLEHLPADAPLDADFLSGATVHRPTSGAGRRALRAATSVVDGADSVYACARAVTDTSAPSAAYRLVVDAGADLEVVYASRVAEYVRAEHAANRREMVATGRYRAFEIPALPFGLFVGSADADASVAVALYDAEPSLVGVLTNDTDEAVAWGESVYRQYREAATEFTDEFRADDRGN